MTIFMSTLLCKLKELLPVKFVKNLPYFQDVGWANTGCILNVVFAGWLAFFFWRVNNIYPP